MHPSDFRSIDVAAGKGAYVDADNSHPLKAQRRQQSDRSASENQERAYVAASRRSDRSLEARVTSALAASEVHKKRTGKALKIDEGIVLREEMYEEEDDDFLPLSKRVLGNQMPASTASFNNKIGAWLDVKNNTLSHGPPTWPGNTNTNTNGQWNKENIDTLFDDAFPDAAMRLEQMKQLPLPPQFPGQLAGQVAPQALPRAAPQLPPQAPIQAPPQAASQTALQPAPQPASQGVPQAALAPAAQDDMQWTRSFFKMPEPSMDFLNDLDTIPCLIPDSNAEPDQQNTSIASPLSTPIVSPMNTPVNTPLLTPTNAPMNDTIMAPMNAPLSTPVHNSLSHIPEEHLEWVDGININWDDFVNGDMLG